MHYKYPPEPGNNMARLQFHNLVPYAQLSVRGEENFDNRSVALLEDYDGAPEYESGNAVLL